MIDYTRLTPAVERAARMAKSSFPSHYELSDVKQELWVWIMENKPTVHRVVGEDDTGNLMVQYLLRAANEFLKKEDAASYGYDEEDTYHYSLSLIKNILEVIFKHEDWQSFASAITDMPRHRSDPSKSGNNLASYADVKSAVERLPEDLYNIVVWRYKYNYTMPQIGSETGMSKQAVSRRLDAALSAVQRSLGKKDLSELRRGYSGREPRTNAASNARTEREYEG